MFRVCTVYGNFMNRQKYHMYWLLLKRDDREVAMSVKAYQWNPLSFSYLEVRGQGTIVKVAMPVFP